VAYIAGYGDDPCVMAARSARSNPNIPLGSQLKAYGQLTLIQEGTRTKYVGRSMVHNVDTCGGQSGAPVWIKRNGIYYLVGVHTGSVELTGGGRANHAVRVTKELIQQVRGWITKTPCLEKLAKPERKNINESEALYAEETLAAPEQEALLEDFNFEEKEKDENELNEQLEAINYSVLPFQPNRFEFNENNANEETILGESFNRLYDADSQVGDELLEAPYKEGEEFWLEEETEEAKKFPEPEVFFARNEPMDTEEAKLTNRPENEEESAEPFDELSEEEGELLMQGELDVDSVKKAIRLNGQYAKKLGWGKYRGPIETYLSKYWVASMWPESDFSKAVARWQKQHKLKPDGIIGPMSWNHMKVLMCLGYEEGEVAKSRTQSGLLKQDVFMTKGGWLVIADFAVGRSELKASTRRENLLREWPAKFEADPPDEILIIGFSDCVGEENNNESLRRSRALEIAKLFGPKARARVRIFSGKMGKYIAENNLTATNRAMNRSVLIQWKQEIKFGPEKIRGNAAKIMTNLVRCATLAVDGIPGKTGERIRKMIGIANRLGYPKNLQLWYYNPQPMWEYFNWRTDNKRRAVMTSSTGGKMPFDGYAHSEQWRIYPFQTMASRYGSADMISCAPEIKNYLIVMHDQIEMSFANIQQQMNIAQSGVHKGAPESFLKHLHELRGTPDHLYSAFR
jgi:hypothetical protein